VHASDEPIGIAGAGRVAQALGRLLFDAGEPVVCIASRDMRHAQAAAEFIGSGVQAVSYSDFPLCASRVVIAVADAGLTEVGAILSVKSGIAEPGIKVALHTCGARGSEALAPLSAKGIACGTIHPLQTIASGAQGVAALHGAAFAIWGDPAALTWAERIATLAGGEALRIAPELKPFYHAAAVMASNYVMALIDSGQTLMGYAGVEPCAALHALAPLLRTSVANALERGPVDALTGPIERGDKETVAAHLKALSVAPEQIRSLYRAAGRQTLDMARRGGLSASRAREMDRILSTE
jgi:predicted short-subunit dehydrogenase-like oxidoreductase (DUF2520 family)